MALILPGNVASATAAGYDVANSCRFNRADSPKHEKDLGTSTDDKKHTFSCWFKKCENSVSSSEHGLMNSTADANNFVNCMFHSTDTWQYYAKIGGSQAMFLRPAALFRDHSAWYHIVVGVDTSQSTDTNRVKIYINGTRVTSWNTEVYPDQNAVLDTNDSSAAIQIGCMKGPANYFHGYMAEVVFIDGLQYAASDFGEFDEDSPTIWKPKDVSGLTFGTNGFYMDFEDSANLGNDANGGTDLSETNLAATDQATDSPTNNFCTLNPLASSIDTTNNVLEEGNLIVDHGDAAYDGGTATFGFLGSQGGKWYWEIEVNADSASANQGEFAGINMANEDHGTVYDAFGTESYLLATTGSNIIYKKDNSAVFTLTDPAGFSAGDHINVALDLDNNKIWFGLNGTYYDMADGSADGDPAGNSDGAAVSRDYDYLPYYRIYGASAQLNFNFGNPPTGFAIASGNADGNGYGNFEYAPPSGFLALCTKNLGSTGG